MKNDDVFRSLGASPYERITGLMRRLRDPKSGCPWDREQTFATIAPYTIEEAYEVGDAIERRDMGDLKEELGDLLLQIVFHAQMADEENSFNFDDVCDTLVTKMIARHPHVFGDHKDEDIAAQTENWENLKALERDQKSTDTTSILDGVALALPALMRAVKLQKRAARVGFDWAEPEQILDKVTEEAAEIIDAQRQGESQDRIEDEVGDLLFVVTNLARKLDVDPEQALRRTNTKFTKRFQYIEQNSGSDIQDLSLDHMEKLWTEAKKTGL